VANLNTLATAETKPRKEAAMQMLGSSRTRTKMSRAPCLKKAWDCGCGRHLEAGSEEALVAKVIHHLDVHHPEAHPTIEQAEELVATEAHEVL
jgi:hypothetical protein